MNIMSSEALLWVDKYRPSNYKELLLHPELTPHLETLSQAAPPHLLFYGPSGAGKKTRIKCMLNALYGVQKHRVQHRTFKSQSGKNIEITTVSSNHHVEVNPSECGINDRVVVMELIKDVASVNSLGGGHKIIVLQEVDRMTRLAQQALRRTMEKYSATCRIVLIAESVARVLEPLRSRCVGIRIGLPQPDAIVKVLQSIALKEGLTLPPELANKLVETSGRNMRRAILQLEATKVTVGSMSLPADVEVMRSDWEYALAGIATMLTRNQSCAQLAAFRKKIQELLAHAIPADVIMRKLTEEILRIADDEIGPEICKVAAKCDRMMKAGTKEIYHIEAFAARFMQVYSKYLKEQASMMD